MSKRYALEREDGHVVIFEPAPGYDPSLAIAKFSETVFRPKSVTEVDVADLPARDEYRDAWEISAGKIEPSIIKAREVHKNILRRQRAPVLAALDLEINKALSQGRNQDVIRYEAERQRLRDVTARPEIDAATSIEDLKKISINE